MDEKFLEYEALKIQIKELETKLDEIKDEIKDHVKPDEKINCKHGIIQLRRRDNWTYTEATTRWAESLKNKQEEEVAMGDAVSEPIYFMEYRSFGSKNY